MKEDIIIHPGRSKREQDIPQSGLLFVTPTEAKNGHRRLEEAGGSNQFLYHSALTVSDDKKKFLAGPAIGAPIAAMTMEKLIVLGATKIILFGWCGTIDPALSIGDVVIGGRAFRGEGTSKYYPSDKMDQPSYSLCSSVQRALQCGGVASENANIWSTDAPYREDRVYIEKMLHDDHVRCVDMEYSALCAVAAFRKIEFAGVFLVSDELYHTSWRPGFTKSEFRDLSDSIVQILLDMDM